MSSQHSFAQQPRASRKRLRINGACNVCRNRKTRCDGRRPVCRACERRCAAQECRYLAKQDINHDQTRVHPPESTTPQGQLNFLSEQAIAPATPVLQEADDDDEAAVDRRPWSSAHGDGLGTFVGRHDASVYGPSSTVAFLQGFLSEGKNGDSPRVTPASRSSTKYPVPERLPERKDGWSLLPRRRSADNFVSCYWDFIHPVFPVLYKPSFTRQYEDFWINESRGQESSQEEEIGDAVFQSTLNLVFALGCKFSDLIPDKEKTAAANGFYQASRQLFVFDVLDSGSLSVVQLLLLNGVYLQSTPHASRCWNSVGLAIRVAQGLGLHLEQTVAKASSQAEREMTRRVWYTCVNLDRLLAMTFGRPAMIPKLNTLALPAMIDDENLMENAGSVEQPSHVPSRLALFVSSCRLMEVLADVLDLLSEHDLLSRRTPKDGEASLDLVKGVWDLDRRLQAVWVSIPSYLQKSSERDNVPSYSSHINLQREVLHCRFLLARLLLLRPLLLGVVARHQDKPRQGSSVPFSTDLDDVVVTRGCELCMQTAIHLVDAVFENLGTPYRSSGWHAVYFTFSSAIVLLASLKCDLLNAGSRDGTFETCWTRVLAILHHFKHQVHSASHAIKMLEAIRRHITNPATLRTDNDQNFISLSTSADGEDGFLSDFTAEVSGNTGMGGVSSNPAVGDVFFGSDINYGDWLDFFA